MGIESSCDETAIAVLADGREVLSNVISSQIEVHKVYGGVVPEIASRHHLNNIPFVFDQALEEAGVSLADIDEYREALMEWIMKLRGLILQSDDSEGKKKLKAAVEYVEQNYMKDLNMAVVSNYISMNYSAFMTIFYSHKYIKKNFL